jgi:hypothetical protein
MEGLFFLNNRIPMVNDLLISIKRAFNHLPGVEEPNILIPD